MNMPMRSGFNEAAPELVRKGLHRDGRLVFLFVGFNEAAPELVRKGSESTRPAFVLKRFNEAAPELVRKARKGDNPDMGWDASMRPHLNWCGKVGITKAVTGIGRCFNEAAPELVRKDPNLCLLGTATPGLQ